MAPQRLRWSSGSVLPLSTQVRGFKPGRSHQDFSGRKNPQHAFFGGEVKPSVPCHRFAACKRSLNWRGSRNFRQNYQLILAHTVPPFTTRILGSLALLWTWGHLSANLGTSKQSGGGDRVSTISLGCSTSVALATGPTDEENYPPEIICLVRKILYHYLHTLNTQSLSDCICLYQTASLSPSLQSVRLSSSHKLLTFLSSSLLFHNISSSFPSIALDIQHLWKPFIVTSGEMCCVDWKIRLYFLIYERTQSCFSTGGVNCF